MKEEGEKVAVIWSSLDGDTDTLRLRLLSIPVVGATVSGRERTGRREEDEPNRLIHIVSRVT
jgi:hypothetical protein